MNNKIEELPRKLSLLDSTMINVGSMIGSGIFIVPAAIAMYVQSPIMVILVWVVGGTVSLFGALSVAELGAMMPRAGGQYVYLKEAYGPLWGFLYGWSAFTVINTASIAAVAVTFATYLQYFIPLTTTGINIIAILSIILLTVINCFGIKLGAMVQNGFTILKIAALVTIAGMSFVLGGNLLSNTTQLVSDVSFSTFGSPFILAMVAALWAYDGWIEITYVAGEVINPQRNIPRSISLATIIVILLYVLISYALMSVLTFSEMSQSKIVASDAAVKMIGLGGAIFISAAVAVSTFGTNNGFIFTCPRIYYAMAKEGLFFRRLAYIHPKFQTPVFSLVAQALIASVLILTGTYSQLFTYVVFASWIFYAMSAGAVFIMRKKLKDAAPPYKTWGYPYTSILFILFSLYLVISTIINDPRDSLIGMGIILLGIPAYYYWMKKKKTEAVTT